MDEGTLLHIAEGETKIARLSLSHSSNLDKLRQMLSERRLIHDNMDFIDSNGYPIPRQDESTTKVESILSDKTKVALKRRDNIPVPNSNIPSLHSRSEQNFLPTKVPESFSTLLPAALPTQLSSSNEMILASDLNHNQRKELFDICQLLYAVRMDQSQPMRGIKPIFELTSPDDCIPKFQVCNESYVQAYTRQRAMNTSFVSNDFFDGGFKVTSPIFALGIDTSYTNTRKSTNVEKTVYSTCVFHHCRAMVTLDASYLKLSENFLNEIDSILEHNPTKSTLEKILATYGHVYPRQVILGGQLFHTEAHRWTSHEVENQIRSNMEARFKHAYYKGFEIAARGGIERRSNDVNSDQMSLITFQAIGGDTILCRNPAQWEPTVRHPRLWQVIERKDCQSVLTLLPPEKQQAVSDIVCYQNPSLLNTIDHECSQSSTFLEDQNLSSIDMDTIVKHAIQGTESESLILSRNKIDAFGVKILVEALEKHNPFKRLKLFDNRLSDDGILTLCRILNAKSSNLTILDIGKNGITTEGVKTLCHALQVNRMLVELRLHKNEIDDEGVKLLVDLLVRNNRTLEDLYLNGNRLITDLSVEYILRLKNSSLRRLTISDCSLSQAAIDQLKTAFVSNNRLRIFA